MARQRHGRSRGTAAAVGAQEPAAEVYEAPLVPKKAKKPAESDSLVWRAAKAVVDPTDLTAHFVVAAVVLFVDLLLSLLIVHRVPYTEIDWSTYMQQVDLFHKGQYNYSEIKGDTGPIVYPAGHVRIFSFFYHLTNAGKNIYLGQLIFVAIYLLNQATVFYIYAQSKRMPPIVNVLVTCVSYRVHSIYMLRLFNDGIAMLLCYLAIAFLVNANAITHPYRTYIASCLFSFGISVKMNILLFAPVFYMVMWLSFGTLVTFIAGVAAGIVQIELALPFLTAFPYDYLTKAFNFKREFLYTWTVNWRCLPEWLFANRTFHFCLLVLHCGLLTYFVFMILLKRITEKYSKNNIFLDGITMRFTKHEIIIGLFVSNFIGVACSRSLHYQFYCWYFHTVPYILFSMKLKCEKQTISYVIGLITRIALVVVLEYCWNVYPSTVVSSTLLNIIHSLVIVFAFRAILEETEDAK
uniref:dolichyl-P-Man:Man5GlcNAc2-PP-dolichol alpha-1,3-mannosyltransferase n=1 Tax=Panagrellus redivivus TaxID=6233 RepID=A0A7E4WBY6_PANRE